LADMGFPLDHLSTIPPQPVEASCTVSDSV
jgi:hypothetical protein